MAPFFILLISWLGFRGLGSIGIQRLKSWTTSGCLALASTFMFTGLTHFTSMRTDYLAMIPEGLPRSSSLIYLTGVLECAGALGLLVPRVRRIAGICLVALLVGLFPANVYAAVAEIPFSGKPPTSLWLQSPIQLAFILAVWISAIRPRAET